MGLGRSVIIRIRGMIKSRRVVNDATICSRAQSRTCAVNSSRILARWLKHEVVTGRTRRWAPSFPAIWGCCGWNWPGSRSIRLRRTESFNRLLAAPRALSSSNTRTSQPSSSKPRASPLTATSRCGTSRTAYAQRFSMPFRVTPSCGSSCSARLKTRCCR